MTVANVGNRAEKRAGKRLNMRVTPASGALDGFKGDLTDTDCRMESKATEKDSLSIKLEWLRKISREASDKNQTPALIIQFVSGSGQPRPDGSWVLLPEWAWKLLR